MGSLSGFQVWIEELDVTFSEAVFMANGAQSL